MESLLGMGDASEGERQGSALDLSLLCSQLYAVREILPSAEVAAAAYAVSE